MLVNIIHTHYLQFRVTCSNFTVNSCLINDLSYMFCRLIIDNVGLQNISSESFSLSDLISTSNIQFRAVECIAPCILWRLPLPVL